jgi:hypothetical protein
MLAHAERLPVGEGGGILRRMPQNIPIALETPITAAQGAEAVPRRVL